MDTNLWQALKACNLFRLLENEKLQMLSMRERSKSKHKFRRTKVCKAEDVREYFISPKIEYNVFG